MPSFNKVIVMGNLTRDPDVRIVGANAVKVCRFALALNERRRDRSGNMVETPVFVEVDAWEKLGEITGETVGEDIIDEIFSRFCVGK